MDTIVQNLHRMSDQLKNRVRALLAHARIEVIPTQSDGEIFIVGCSWWGKLPPAGIKAQSEATELFTRYAAILRSLFTGRGREGLGRIDESCARIKRIIDQTSQMPSRVEDEENEALQAIDQQIALLAALYNPSSGTPVFVPDTNALLANPGLDAWQFPSIPKFSIVLTPTVVRELDGHKFNHRNENVRKKSERLINQIKEYRRRGSLTEGVVLRKDISTIMAVATEPDFELSLPWLDPENNDDRILANVLEVVRRFPHLPVTLVTSDINLQNKAEFAQVPVIEPPFAPTEES